jgi:hypothetical protein
MITGNDHGRNMERREHAKPPRLDEETLDGGVNHFARLNLSCFEKRVRTSRSLPPLRGSVAWNLEVASGLSSICGKLPTNSSEKGPRVGARCFGGVGRK